MSWGTNDHPGTFLRLQLYNVKKSGRRLDAHQIGSIPTLIQFNSKQQISQNQRGHRPESRGIHTPYPPHWTKEEEVSLLLPLRNFSLVRVPCAEASGFPVSLLFRTLGVFLPNGSFALLREGLVRSGTCHSERGISQTLPISRTQLWLQTDRVGAAKLGFVPDCTSLAEIEKKEKKYLQICWDS